MMPSPIPVTILTGFLGAGKTTLLNHLLNTNQADHERIAVVENEFGTKGVDAALLGLRPGVEVIELPNGCICCSIRTEMTQALTDLLARRDAKALTFDRLILETTGLADPAPIVQTFFTDEHLRARFRLDAVITVVDAEHIQKQLNEHRVAVSQIGLADRLIMTKLDRVEKEAQTLLIDRLRKINARAPILEAQHGQLAREQWIDICAFNLNETLTLDAAFIRPRMTKTPGYHNIGVGTALLTRSWSDDICSHVLEGGRMDLKRIGTFMENTVEKHGHDMLRYKGILAIAGEPRRLIVQGVHRIVGFDYGTQWKEADHPCSLLVIIGRNLPIDKLREGFSTSSV